MKPERIELTEEMILNETGIPEYMKGCRRFRIEYRDPVSGFSNFEGTVYLPNIKELYDYTNQIEKLLAEAYSKLEV